MDRTISHVLQLTLEVLYVVRFCKKKLFLLELLLGFVWCVVLFGGGTLLLKCSGFIQHVWCTSAKWKLQRGMFKKTKQQQQHPKKTPKPHQTPQNPDTLIWKSLFFFSSVHITSELLFGVFWFVLGFLLCGVFFVLSLLYTQVRSGLQLHEPLGFWTYL